MFYSGKRKLQDGGRKSRENFLRFAITSAIPESKASSVRPKTHEERKAKDLIDSVVKEYLESNQIYLTEIKPFGDFQFDIVFDRSGPEPRGEIAAPMYFVACVYKYQRDMYLAEGRHEPHFIIPIEEEGSVQAIGKSVSMLNQIFEEDDA